MPIVPTYKEQQFSSSPLPNNGLNVQSSPEHFGAGFGQVTEQYAGVFAEAKQRANVALAQDASLQLRQKANELMNDPRNGLLSMQGKNAIGKGYEFEQAFDSAAGEIAGTLQDDAIKSMFAQQAKEMRLQFSSQANKHELGQIQVYEQDQFQATLDINAESAANLYGDNGAYLSANKQVFQQIEEFGFSHGWSDEQILAKKQEFKTATAKRAIENQIGSDYMQFMQQNGEPSDNGGISRSSTYYGGSVGSTQGMIEQGNINLLNRPTVKNKDGSISTVRTISIGTDQGEVLIPTVSDDGRLLSDDEAIALFEETGNHLGVFDNPDDATAYAESLHNQQEKTYTKNGSGALGVRNNNPGNIRKSKDVWVGQTGNDGSFVTFATPAHGIRATGKNLLSYARQGYVTPEQIITRWAPPEDNNDTEGYIKFVSDYLNVPRDTVLDLTDLDTLTRLSMAIMIQENGKDEVAKLSSNDLSSGIQSALGLVSLPDSPQASKRLTGSVAFNALDASDQAKYIKQASLMDKERQQQEQEQLGTALADSFAAWERGLDAPNAPAEKTIISAFGYEKGTAMIADMREAKRYAGLISGAKGMTPQAQRSLRDSIMPHESETNYASKMQRWEKFSKFVDDNIKAQDKVFSANRFQLSIQNNFPLDPNDKDNQDAADNYFTNNIESSFNIRDENSLNAVVEVSSRTGIIPSQIKSKLVIGSTSKNPELVIPMAKMYGQIFDNRSSAVKELSSDAMAYYGKIYSLTRAGMDGKEALEIAYKDTYEQNDMTKKMLSEMKSGKKYENAREKAAQGNINSFFAMGGWTSPSIDKPSINNNEYKRDYFVLYDANFDKTGGDHELAKINTDAQIKTMWGVTSINGKDEVMRYAPEAVYGINESGAGNWIIGQWREEQKQLKTKVFGGMPDDAQFILVPDAITARDSSYSIQIKQVGSDKRPIYIQFLGDNGLPLRFKPEQSSSPMYREVMDKRQKTYQEVVDARNTLDGNTKQEPIDYGLTNTLNTMFDRE
ncbi:hypothetical protein [Providencia stuartii]|uniref:hypothetical protein n=1 Tax=Providencia stuartii TaxID=588 RepID=UPI00197EB717|nr:hypothetical protein [Providencia stuartii]MBN4863281.1 hypothetical protein [Providencia stuartii]MBN4876460.1 hypothetical protein [Providencia stuartii]MBN4878276.1 hypothetical protein [Providencia stuartii]MBN4881804.1 hypothetical protein [Providencia stuartii]